MGRRRRRSGDIVIEPAKFAELRQEAFEMKKVDEEGREAIVVSAGVQSAQDAGKLERIAFIRNVAFSTSASDLVMFLRGRLDSPGSIVRCEILQRDGRSRGCALVTFTDQIGIDRIAAMSPLLFHGRPMHVNLQNGGQWRDRQKDAGTQRFALTEMLLAASVAGDGRIGGTAPLPAMWRASRKVRIEINGRDRRQFAIEFNNKFRVEFPLKHVRETRLVVDESGRSVLRLRLSRPPHCFSAAAHCDEGDDLSLRMLSLLLNSSRGQFLWDTAGETEARQWERTIDPSGCNAFAHCLLYDLVIDATVNTTALLKGLSDFSLRVQRTSIPIALPDFSHLLVKGNQWTAAFDDIFAPLPFPIAYMVHAALGVSKLPLRDRNDAQRLHCALAAHPNPQIAIDILDDWVLDYRPRYSIDKLVEQLLDTTPVLGGGHDVEGRRRPTIFIRRVLVTPLRVCPQPLELDAGNRVLRQFSDHLDRFIRVTFCDENWASILAARSDDVFERMRHLLHTGVVVAGRTFVFLAYSNSQLREQSCWMYDEGERGDCRGGQPTAAAIRESIGDLSHISLVGKHAARLGQAFSTTTSTVSISAAQTTVIRDVERNGYCFSDGVGIISPSLARQVCERMGLDPVASAFQIRFRGSKGVVGVSHNAVADLCLRPSMTKFAGSNHCDLEICSVAKAAPCYLNRQVITVLSSLGVDDQAFMRLLEIELAHLDAAQVSIGMAQRLVREHANGSMAMRMLNAGIDPRRDRHLRELMFALRDRLLLDLQLKARILVPGGISLVGIMDESGTLAPDTVFFQTRPGTSIAAPLPGTRLAVGRSPCLHPGDIRVLTLASPTPDLAHLFDVIVFSSKGDRPQANMMSGGDLDGDIFFAIWETSLVPEQDHAPMDYSPPLPSPRSIHTGVVEARHIVDFFVDYIKNDRLGVIANAHVVFADVSPEGAQCKECLDIAKLHSTAVDFAKTGVPAVVPRNLHTRTSPDFMENNFKEMYQSTKVLGRIYRRARGKSFQRQRHADNGFNAAMVARGWEAFAAEAKQIYDQFCWELWDIACYYEIWDEAELVSGWVRSMSRKVSNGNRRGDTAARLHLAVDELMSEYRDMFWAGMERNNPDDELKAIVKASAWYKVAYEGISDDSGYQPYLSFAWIAIGPLSTLAALCNNQR